MSNFTFIRAEWPELFDVCQRAESYAFSDPNAAAMNARIAVEQLVSYLFVEVFGLDAGYRSDLSARMNDPAFKNRTSVINTKLNLIRRIGNAASHDGRRLTTRDSVNTLRDLFDIVVWVVKHHSTFPEAAPLGASFDETVAQRRAPLSQAQLAELAARFSQQATQLEHLDTENERLDAENATLRAQIAAAQASDTVADTRDYGEDEARNRYIDALLHEAGWPLDTTRDREYPVTGMPIIPGKNTSGHGFIDYVLWGADGNPLGIVEAKRTGLDPAVGAPQARLYADALEREFGQRPVIFLSNGRTHQIWDDASGYPPREVAGFYTPDELALMVQRRTRRTPLTGANADTDIAGRGYQLRAIAKAGEHFDAKQRRALLVMATGTGKTRTAIALTKLLLEHGWVKRVLFLADRNALITQAGRAFSKLLPNYAAVNLTDDKVTEGRIYLSTYPTMMNLIDDARNGGVRRFGPGAFDLIIVDEAHRSVYQKYGEIFSWFDALLLGLTATPVDDISRSTYALFGLESGIPTDAYPLNDAIADGYLVPPEPIVYDYGFHRDGIRYDDLSDDAKEEWDSLDWEEEGDGSLAPTTVEAPRVFRSLFNADTADKALAELMNRGLRASDTDRIGKTIVFAMNQRHALFLKERFDAKNPHLGGDFAQVITSQSTYAQQLIDDFSVPEKAPHIAISVDMLDTGIDVPEVQNLMLFKQVHSKTKFWQMIGRGTRLSPGLLGDSGDPAHDDKQSFRVFDFCGNVDYFDLDRADQVAPLPQSLSQRLFTTRVRLVSRIDQTGVEADVRDAATGWLRAFVAGIPVESFVARKHRDRITEFSDAERWREPVGLIEAEDLAAQLGGLPSAAGADAEQAKRFDLIMLQRALAQLEGNDRVAERTQARVQAVSAQLLEKLSVPQVREAAELLEEVSGGEWWEQVTLAQLERARLVLRQLVQFLDRAERQTITVNWEDDLGEGRDAALTLTTVGVDVKRFREKVEAYIRGHADHIAIQRLRRNRPLTATDLAELERILIEQGEGTPEALARVTGERGLGVFVRSLVGLDRAAAEEAFAARLAFSGLNSRQMEFLRHVIDELTRRGEMQPSRLFDPPYSDDSSLRVDLIFPEPDVLVILDTLRDLEGGAQAAA